jgi:hypothetical protein
LKVKPQVAETYRDPLSGLLIVERLGPRDQWPIQGRQRWVRLRRPPPIHGFCVRHLHWKGAWWFLEIRREPPLVTQLLPNMSIVV